MRNRIVYYIATGGTIGSGLTDKARDVDPAVQDKILRFISKIPATEYRSVNVKMKGDSSAHPREHLLDLGRAALKYAAEKDGILISYWTDTMNLAAGTLALMGNEMWRFPVTFLGSMKGLEKTDSDAPKNALAAAFFTAYGNASGVFAVRPHGTIITSRHDTPGGSIDWHGRGIPQSPDAFFARVLLHQLIDRNYNVMHENVAGYKTPPFRATFSAC